MQVQPYLFFDGRCEEAIAFYEKTLGAKVQRLMRFKEAPDQSMISPGSGEKVMHADIKVGDSTLLLSDGRNSGHPDFKGFGLTIIALGEAEANRVFASLAEGGKVTMPLAQTFFSPRFGMLTDKFGVGWMVLAAK